MNYLEPFDLERAFAGEPVCTVLGNSVVIDSFKFGFCRPIIGAIMIDSHRVNSTWTLKGNYNDNDRTHSSRNLRMAPKQKKRIQGWVNGYYGLNGKPYLTACIFESREKALARTRVNNDRAFCIYLDVGEEDGLDENNG